MRKEERELFEIIQEVFTEGKLLKLGKDLTYLENKKAANDQDHTAWRC